jgi:hypothetical protein
MQRKQHQAHQASIRSSTEPPKHPLFGQQDLLEHLVRQHFLRRHQFLPARFKRYPRFTIFTQRDGDDNSHLINQMISLNPQVFAMLAATDEEQIHVENQHQ